jgi:hypothetical protein
MHTISSSDGNSVTVEVSGKLTEQDYNDLIPTWTALIERHGTMRLLFVMHDFHGWDARAAWDDFRFDLKHGHQVQRIAMVGEKKWQQWMTKIASWFVGADVRYFDALQRPEAEQWLKTP